MRKLLLFFVSALTLALGGSIPTNPRDARHALVRPNTGGISAGLIRVQTPEPKAKKTKFTYRSEMSPYPALYFLVRRADLIVVGTAGSVVRQGRTPWDLPKTELGGDAKTIRQFDVEMVLKGDPGLPTIKVMETGAIIDGTAYLVEGRPRLVQGRRYILFLRFPPADMAKKYGHWVQIVGDQVYNDGDLDEYPLVGGGQAKLLIENGVVRAPYDNYQSARVEPFVPKYSGQLLGATESAAVEEIRQTLEDTKYPFLPPRRKFGQN